jgi:hypothetical protein
MRRFVDRGIALRVTYHLRNAGSIPQVDEHDGSVITTPLNPALKHNALSGLISCQLSASMGALFHAVLLMAGRARP